MIIFQTLSWKNFLSTGNYKTTLDLTRHDTTLVSGENGAGKSTQFKILIGEEEQTSGTIIKEGNPKIAHLKQEFDCNLNFSVRKELESSFKDIQIFL